MDFFFFNLIIIVVSFTGIVVNIFLVFCMFCPQQRTVRLKQPLNVLLGTLVGCNITLQLCNLICEIITYSPGFMSYFWTIELAYFTMRTSVTSSFWLNVFYFCQIVPAQHRFFIRLKRNIRLFIYTALIGDKIFFLFGFTAGITCAEIQNEFCCGNTLNEPCTRSNETQTPISSDDPLQAVFVLDTWLRCCYLSLCLCVMLGLNCVTIRYLQKHMNFLEESNFSSVRVRRQMRVTLTGIVQTFLSLFCFVWMIVDELLPQYIDLYAYICGTVACLYSLGTTINLCVGQTIFRSHVVEIYQKWQQKFS